MNITQPKVIEINEFVWIINNSQNTSRKMASTFFNLYCPIFSENRISGNLVFTVVPYQRPTYFDLKEPESHNLTLIEVIKELAAHALDTSIEEIGTRKLPTFDSYSYKLQVSLRCNRPSSHLIDYVDETEIPGKALDLGCGVGANTIPLLERNWEVTGIDLFNDSLFNLYKKAAELNASVDLIRGDITTLPFEVNRYDLVLAVDTLPYTPARNLVSMVMKIHTALKPNGIFIGTFFFLPKSKKISKHIKFYNSIGCEFLKDYKLPREILRNTGFEILKINFRLEMDSETAAIEVTAKKI